MTRRVVYLMSGPAHMPYLVCSLWTLRQHWDGEIVVVAWPNSIELVEEVARDRVLIRNGDGRRHILHVDLIVLCTGYRATPNEVQRLKNKVPGWQPLNIPWQPSSACR